ncbi:unnamed protein product [Adineta steineri]|uniref:Tryptophan 2,3-dioxygenase n=1 Tax=Adineta steineri TaxID=433720 RepID=A0A814M642_9BILA|nr:unnamed protein product [Adineta steineri]CAF1163470.1 unnamed protein product [Adineta steineri]
MPCPYAQLIVDDTKHINDSSDSDTSIVDEVLITKTAVNGTGNHHQSINEPLNYATYLRTDLLLSALKCLSHTDPLDNNSPPVHDEHFFILIHQVFELWFKQILFEIDSIRHIFTKSDNVIPSLFNINLRLKRSVKILNILVDQFELLDSMTPIEFLEFRGYLSAGSGFQSLQFRIIEMKLGLTDRFRSSFKTKYFTGTMFKGEQNVELEQAINEESLLIQIERWLETIYDNTSFDFLTVFTSSVEHFIEHGKKQKIMNGIAVETAERDVETSKRLFASMIDSSEYQKLLNNNERRISHKAMLTALMISLYHQQPCFQQAYQMLGLLMDVDALMASWRYKHMLLVQRQIGRKPGTGGTGGFSYLQQTIT